MDITFYVLFRQHLRSKAAGNDKWGAYRKNRSDNQRRKVGTSYQVLAQKGSKQKLLGGH